MEESVLDRLVSPCKRLKLQSPGKSTEHMQADIQKPHEITTETLTNTCSAPIDTVNTSHYIAEVDAPKAVPEDLDDNERDNERYTINSNDNFLVEVLDVTNNCSNDMTHNCSHDMTHETDTNTCSAEAATVNPIDDMVKVDKPEAASENLPDNERDIDNGQDELPIEVLDTLTTCCDCAVNDDTETGTNTCESVNEERMFCLTGEPVCVLESEVDAIETADQNTDEITNVNEEPKVCDVETIERAQFGGDEARKDKHTKVVHFIIPETDLDATLTNGDNENIGTIATDSCESECKTKADQDAVAPSQTENVHQAYPLEPTVSILPSQTESLEAYPLEPTVTILPSQTESLEAYPLEPTVTILPVSIRKWLNDQENDEQYPVLKTFKPENTDSKAELIKPDMAKVVNSIPVAKECKSVPLCTSTPIAKQQQQQQGLRLRDMNVIRMEADIDVKVGKVNRNIDVENTKQVHVHDRVNEDDIVNVKNDKNSKEMKRDDAFKRDRESKREKKKMKGTRIQKYKEYIGPGLTSNMNKENEQAVDPGKRDFVKNTDIQTCTLTEYKGFGLTGPLPNKPLKASTPLPPGVPTMGNPNTQAGGATHVGSTLPRFVGGMELGQRPAGTEGLILANYGFKPQTQGGENGLVRTQNPSLMTGNHSGSNVQIVMKGSCSGQQSLTDHSSQFPSGTSSALQPDEAYPSLSSNHDNKSENSNTDKSDKSEKLFDPKVLQSPGQLKVSAYMNFGLLTVHVVQARQLCTKWKPACDSFVKMCLIPDDGKKPRCKTDIIQDSNNPLYDEKFSFELTDEDHSKRLMISVWHRDQSASVNEFLGCMSFGIRHLTNPKKEVSGWYYLLTEDIGRKKHLQVSQRQRPQLKVRGTHANIPSVNKDVWGTESVQLTIHRGKNGFGFSVVEACPVKVGRVDGASPAETAGLQPGDIIVRLNRQNVSRSTATSVAKLIKHCSNTLLLELHRPKPVTLEHEENSFWQMPSNNQDFLGNPADPYHYDDQDDLTVPQMFTLHDNVKENDFPAGDMTVCSLNPNIASLATSTPLPLLARGHTTVQTSEVRKQEAIHRLLSLELDFIDLMHSGMQRYSRPLRHCILSHSQHTALFQNIEKLTTISEYHVKQMHDNAPSSFLSEDTDTSLASDNHSFVLSIGLIYQSKVHMLCQAYDLYAKGIARANQVLSELRHNPDFKKFIKDSPSDASQPSISAFIYRPVQHIRELYRVVQEIFLNTTSESSDYTSLKQVVEGLQECANTITNYSNCCERVESMSSLTSRESKTSFTSSMKSRSSSSSGTSSSSRGQGYQGPSCSLQSSKSADLEVMKIQDRLVFSSNVRVFQLCQEDRHVIFSGDMFKWEGHQWVKVNLYLFTDMILQTVRESDGYLRVTHEPIMLKDVVAMDAQRHHGTELILYCNDGHSGNQKCSFRAPSTEQKYAWKSLIEQRVFAVRGSLEYYSSTSDVSSSSASAIVI